MQIKQLCIKINMFVLYTNQYCIILYGSTKLVKAVMFFDATTLYPWRQKTKLISCIR